MRFRARCANDRHADIVIAFEAAQLQARDEIGGRANIGRHKGIIGIREIDEGKPARQAEPAEKKHGAQGKAGNRKGAAGARRQMLKQTTSSNAVPRLPGSNSRFNFIAPPPMRGRKKNRACDDAQALSHVRFFRWGVKLHPLLQNLALEPRLRSSKSRFCFLPPQQGGEEIHPAPDGSRSR